MWVRAGEGEVTDQFVILMGLTPIQKINLVVMVTHKKKEVHWKYRYNWS
jgi:hypothetical protein